LSEKFGKTLEENNKSKIKEIKAEMIN